MPNLNKECPICRVTYDILSSCDRCPYSICLDCRHHILSSPTIRSVCPFCRYPLGGNKNDIPEPLRETILDVYAIGAFLLLSQFVFTS